MELALEQYRAGRITLREIRHVAWQQIKDQYDKDWKDTYGER